MLRSILTPIFLAALLFLAAIGWYANYRTPHREAVLNLPEGKKLTEVTRQDETVFYSLRARHGDELPETYTVNVNLAHTFNESTADDALEKLQIQLPDRGEKMTIHER